MQYSSANLHGEGTNPMSYLLVQEVRRLFLIAEAFHEITMIHTHSPVIILCFIPFAFLFLFQQIFLPSFATGPATVFGFPVNTYSSVKFDPKELP